MENASKRALKYKVKDGGVNANYFKDEFGRHGLSTEYIVDKDSEKRSKGIIRNLRAGNKVVLMGQDEQNTTKKNSPFGPNDHYVVATGLSKDGRRIRINDPEASLPDIEYPTSVILDNSSMGISAHAGSGSGLVNNMTIDASSYSGMGTKNKTVEAQVWNFFKMKGLSDQAVAGIMGNIYQESKFNPSLIQGNGRGPAAGLFQWENYNTKSGRWKRMYNFAKKRKKNWTDLLSQLEYAYHECTKGYEAGVFKRKYGGFNKFKKITNVDKATEVFERVFERAGKPMMDTRKKQAREYYKKFKGTMGTPVGTTAESSGGYSGTNEQFLKICEETAKYIIDHKWIYISAPGLPQTWAAAKKEKKGRTSCAHYVCLCMQRFGTLKPHEMFYSDGVGKIKYQYGSHKKSAEKHIKQYYDIIKVGGKKNYRKYLKKPGDICLWNGHTCVFAGFNDKNEETYYDFGRGGTSDGKPRSGPFVRLKKVGKQNHKLYWIFRLKEGASLNGELSSGGSSGTSKVKKVTTMMDHVSNIFQDLSAAFGLSSNDTSSSSDADNTSTVESNDNDNAMLSTKTKYKGKYVDERQLQLVNKMTSWIGTLKYSQSGPRNPHKKSADCSSTTQYAYKDVLGVDPGSWSGGQFDNKNTYTVVSGKYDESKMQMGDLCLYKKGYGGSKWGHSDMYVGQGHVLSHGSSKRKGPNYAKFGYHGKPWKIRRWKGFKNKGKTKTNAKGSGLVDYLYDSYGMGSGLDADENVILTNFDNGPELIENNEKDIKDMPAQMYAAGSGLKSKTSTKKKKNEPVLKAKATKGKFKSEVVKAPGRNAITKAQPNYKDLYREEKERIRETGKDRDGNRAYFRSIIRLLSRNVQNTAMLSTVVTILTELVKIAEEEKALANNPKATEEKKADLNARRASMINILKSTGIQSENHGNNELTKLIEDAERLARI